VVGTRERRALLPGVRAHPTAGAAAVTEHIAQQCTDERVVERMSTPTTRRTEEVMTAEEDLEEAW
jgi:hypothetical protein